MVLSCFQAKFLYSLKLPFVALTSTLLVKGLCHPRGMRPLMRSTLKSLAQLYQIPSKSRKLCSSSES